MKKVAATLTVVALLAIGAAAYAHGPGGWGGGAAGAMYGYGRHMGPGYGPMMGWTGGQDREFFEETADLRRELHAKRFEYFEATRKPERDAETITKLEEEIRELQDKIHDTAPGRALGRVGGYGCQW